MLSIQERRELDKMTYIRVDQDWLHRQLAETGAAGTRNGSAILQLVGLLESFDFKTNQVDEVSSILQRVETLFLGQPLSVDKSENWKDAVPGEISVRDTVRVKVDAYVGFNGSAHNGKRGRVVALRNGLASVVYDNESHETPPQHKITSLQILDVE